MNTWDKNNNTKLTIRILQIIRSRTIDNPIKCRELSRMFNFRNDRVITHIIEELRDYGEWVCASQTKPFGYYYARNKVELQEYINKERDRVLQQLARQKKQLDFIPNYEPELFEGII
jgi:hypothetical protein